MVPCTLSRNSRKKELISVGRRSAMSAFYSVDWHMSGSPVSSFCAHSVLCLFAFLYAGVLRGVMFLTGRLTPWFAACTFVSVSMPPPPRPLPPHGHIWDVMLVGWKGKINKNCFVCYSIVYYYNGAHAQRYEQFL